MAAISFVIHPLTIEQLVSSFSALYFPKRLNAIFDLLIHRIPVSIIKRNFSRVSTHVLMQVKDIQSKQDERLDILFIMLPFFPEQIVSLPTNVMMAELKKCVKIAKRFETKLLALGAFSSVVGNEGEDIAKLTHFPITSGNTYTTALCIQGLMKAADFLCVPIEKSTVLIIGATGDIGMGSARMLSRKCKRIILCSRTLKESDSIVGEIRKENAAEVIVANDIKKNIGLADFVLSATSSFSFLFTQGDLKKYSIVCDVSLPFSIERSTGVSRSDVFVFDGGKAKLPYFNRIVHDRWRRFFPQNSIYGCLAEALILGFEGLWQTYSIGRGNIGEEKINQMLALAERHGIELADFSFGSKFYSREALDALKKNFANRE